MVSEYEEIGKGKGYAEIVYEDSHFVAFVQEKAIVPGQITVIPRVKYTIFEMLPSQLMSKLFEVVKKLSGTVFETLKCHGTNVLIENGISAGQDQPVFSVHIIPRFQDDNVPLMWEPKQLEDYDMDDALSQLTATPIKLGNDIVADGPDATTEDEVETPKKSSPEDVAAAAKAKKEESRKQEESNYLIKSLRKIP